MISPIIVLLLIQSYMTQPVSQDIIELNFHKKSYLSKSKLTYDSLGFLDPQKYSIFQDSYPLINSINDEMIINLCLGTPNQCFNVLVDSGSYYLWIRDIYSEETGDAENKFDYKNSTTFENTNKIHTINYGTGMAEGYISKDVLTLGDKQIDRLNFILVNKEQSNAAIDGILGLGYYYDVLNEDNPLEFSLIDQLYKKNQIKNKIFTQKYTEDKKGIMYIGDIPDEIRNDMSNYGSCPAIKYLNNNINYPNPKWECELKKVFYGNKNLYDKAEEINEPVLFDTGTNIIIVPLNFIMSLKKHYFNKLIESKDCITDKENNRFYVFKCKPSDKILELPHINFVFGEWIIKMRPVDLFYRGPDGYLHFFMTSADDLNLWIFGETILKKYHMVYDKTNDLIGFYGTTDLYRYDEEFPDDGKIILTLLLVLACIMLTIGIVYFFVWLVKRKKESVVYYSPDMNFNLMKKQSDL